ncbi:MAG TPA: hypothetical protein VNN79_19745 [Actinomycetota bacterium]|nr:hypothetical protein [Actinomycetota bacterium]
MRDTEPTGEAEGWARNERDRLLVGIDATPAERLAWLEEMIRVAHRTGALPRPTEDERLGSRASETR